MAKAKTTADTDTSTDTTADSPLLSTAVAEIPATESTPAVTIEGVDASKVQAMYLPSGDGATKFVAAIVTH